MFDKIPSIINNIPSYHEWREILFLIFYVDRYGCEFSLKRAILISPDLIKKRQGV